MLSADERNFIDSRRVAHLATADAHGEPHAMPVTFALAGDVLYIAIDQKPKRSGGPPLKRLANIAANPATAVIFDHYDEDWSRLGWVMLRGRADILVAGDEHTRAQALVRARYPQLGSMQLDGLPVIAVRIGKVTSWGRLSPAGAAASD